MASEFFTELFVNNLAPTTTENDLKIMFSIYGVVESVWVTQKKGVAFGVVRFSTHAEAATAKKTLNHHDVNNRLIGVKWSNNQRVLWVGSLPEGTTNEALAAAFEQFGPLERSLVVLDTLTSASRRYGFVAYRERKHAQAAHAKLQEQPLLLNGSLIPVRATWAQTDDWDQGFSEAAKAGLRQPSVVKYTTEDVARFPAPGTADFIMAQRFRQLQADYQAAKAALKAQLKQAEQQLLQGGPQPVLRATLGAAPPVRPGPPAGPPPPVPPPIASMPGMAGPPGPVPPPRPSAPWAAGSVPGPVPPPASLLGRRDRQEDFHQVPPPKRPNLPQAPFERFNPLPSVPPPAAPPAFSSGAPAATSAPKFVHAESKEFSAVLPSGQVKPEVVGASTGHVQQGYQYTGAQQAQAAVAPSSDATTLQQQGYGSGYSGYAAGAGYSNGYSQQQALQQQQQYGQQGMMQQAVQQQAPPQQQAYAGYGTDAGGQAQQAGYVQSQQYQALQAQLQQAAQQQQQQYGAYQGYGTAAQNVGAYAPPPDMTGWQQSQ